MAEGSIIFSVIVPTFNRARSLQRTIESLWAQDFAGGYEVIIVNDGSRDGSSGLLSHLAHEGRIVYLEQPNGGPAKARNLGLQHARGEFIAFIDDDCVAPPDWLTRYAEKFRSGKAAGYGGCSRTASRTNLCALTIDHTANFFKDALNSGAGQGVPFLTSNNAAYRRSALHNVSGFDPRFRVGAEERDLNNRLARAGERLEYVPEIIVDHYNECSFSGFISHQFGFGKGSYLLYHGSDGSARPSRIPPRVYTRLIGSSWRYFGLIGGTIVACLMVIGEAAVMTGYVVQSRKTPPGLSSHMVGTEGSTP